MPVKIRLTRFGRTKQAFYNIVVAHDRTANRKRPLEVLGTYDPTPRRGPYEMNNRDPALGPPKAHKDIMLDMTRTKYWIGCGVQPTPAAWKILAKVRGASEAATLCCCWP